MEAAALLAVEMAITANRMWHVFGWNKAGIIRF